MKIWQASQEIGRPFPDGPQYSGAPHNRPEGLDCGPIGQRMATVDKWQNPERGAKFTGYCVTIVPPVGGCWKLR